MRPFSLQRGLYRPRTALVLTQWRVAVSSNELTRFHSGCADHSNSSGPDATKGEAKDQHGVRVRYAPSPTGSLHLGGLRTALFNFLFARAHGGSFLLRIEDTDKLRQKPGSIDGLIRALQWCGLDYDEGPARIADNSVEQPASNPGDPHAEAAAFTSKGSFGPYIQSQRLPLYKQHADQLLQSGHAYRCFCSPERLQALRDAQAKAGIPSPVYDRHCLKSIKPADAERRAQAGEPHVIRMLVPQQSSSTFDDNVLGVVSFSHAGVDDQVLIKSDGYPTYHLASCVDDHAMKISHVIRGQEWLSSTPKHLILYKAFGWQPPMFAHLPLLLNADRSKLSKRHGDASVEDFMASGYLPEALVNFVAFLGWSPPLPGQVAPNQPAATAVSAAAKGGANKKGASATASSSSADSSGAAGVGSSGEVMDLSRMIELFRQSYSPAGPAGTTTTTAAAAMPLPRLSRINKANAVVDNARLDFFNGQHIKRMLLMPGDSAGIERVRRAVLPLLAAAYKQAIGADLAAVSSSDELEHFNALLLLQHERVKRWEDYPFLLMPFVVSDRSYEMWMRRQGDEGKDKMEAKLIGLLAKHNNSGSSAPAPAPASAEGQQDSSHHHQQLREALAAGTRAHASLKTMVEALDASSSPSTSASSSEASFLLDTCKKAACGDGGGGEQACPLPNGLFMNLMRYLMTGSDVGAALSDTMRMLGKDEVTARLKFWLQ